MIDFQKVTYLSSSDHLTREERKLLHLAQTTNTRFVQISLFIEQDKQFHKL